MASESWLPQLGHGMCYAWDPTLVVAHAAGDLVVWLAYLSLAIATAVLSSYSTQLRTVLQLFSAFILACGMTHLISMVVIWYPWYELLAVSKHVTATLSVMTAIAVAIHWKQVRDAIRRT